MTLDPSYLRHITGISRPVLAFVLGLVGAMSPCFMVTAPLTVAMVAGGGPLTPRRGVYLGACLLIGMAAVYVPLGAGASALVGLLSRGSSLAYGLMGGLCLVSGLGFWDLLEIPSVRIKTYFGAVGPLGALATGSAIALASSPCSSPFLIAAIGAAAGSEDSLAGGVLMLAYSAGHALPFLVAGASGAMIKSLLESPRIRRWERVIRIVGGMLMLLLSSRFFYLAF